MIMEELLDKILKTYNAKNSDYGNSFNITLDEEGLVAARVRLRDKFNRFATLSKGSIPNVEESIEDTLLDMATYALMTVLWLNNKNS